MGAILLAVTGFDPNAWEERFRALAPQRDIRLWPQRLGDPAEIAYACAWQVPRGVFAALPRLQAIFSLGAGVDHLIADAALPPVPVVRIVDPDLTMRMTEYVVLHVLMQQGRMPVSGQKRRNLASGVTHRVTRKATGKPVQRFRRDWRHLGTPGGDRARRRAR
jgi:glyoxylate/hydroxypyruvate reductase